MGEGGAELLPASKWLSSVSRNFPSHILLQFVILWFSAKKVSESSSVLYGVKYKDEWVQTRVNQSDHDSGVVNRNVQCHQVNREARVEHLVR